MDTYLPLIVALVVLLLLGYTQMQLAHRTALHEYKELAEYSQTFDVFATALLRGSFDGDRYAWLTRNVNHTHRLLGIDAYFEEFKKPYMGEVIRNFAILPNVLAELRQGDKRIRQYLIMACDDAMLRGIGTIEQRGRELEAERRNPLIWLREGVRFVATLPIRLLLWSGLISESRFEKASGSVLGNILTLLVGLLSLLASIIQITQVWGPLISFFGFGR
jgi:hypothetical protein